MVLLAAQHILCVLLIILLCEVVCVPLSFAGFWMFKRIMLTNENAANLQPEILVGLLERIFVATAIAFNISGAATAMIAWTALKAQSKWQVFTAKPVEKEQGAAKLYVSLLGSMFSMCLAMLVGTFAGEVVPPPKPPAVLIPPGVNPPVAESPLRSMLPE